MKKVLIIVLSVFLISLLFISCQLNIDDPDAFDLNEEVMIKVGERLFENELHWVKLNRIIEDTRAPEDFDGLPEYVKMEFSVGSCDTTGRINWSTKITITTDTTGSASYIIPFTNNIDGGVHYILTVTDVLPEIQSVGEKIADEDYRVYFVLEMGYVARKPNIYLYPKITGKMDVSLDFPQGGHVTVSDPNYPEEWQNIKVKPSGKIDGQHEFLFYEAALPDRWQYDKAWSVKQQNLKTFFQNNLTEYGFNKREIADFTDYWIPRLKESPYYAIYPQHTAKIDEVVELNISKNPKSILRLFYVIKDIPEFEDMPIPMIPDFERKGFTVTEWGVVLK